MRRINRGNSLGDTRGRAHEVCDARAITLLVERVSPLAYHSRRRGFRRREVPNEQF